MVIFLFKKIIKRISCSHQWKEINKTIIRDDFYDMTYHLCLLKCKKCGKIIEIRSN